MKKLILLAITLELILVPFHSYSQDFGTDIQLANEYFNNLQYAEAALLFEKWLPAVKEDCGDEDTSVYVTLLSMTGKCFQLSGQYDKALPFYELASTIYKDLLGVNHPEYATSLNNLASLYESMAFYEKALLLYEQARTIRLQVLGANHPDYATSLNNLAGFYLSMGNYDKALPLYEQASTIRLRVLGANHLDYAASLNNLAALYKLMGNYDKAVPLHEQASTILLRGLGANHPDYATSLNNLALLYKSMGSYDKALPLFVQSKTIRLQVLGANHPDYAVSLNNLANLYQSMGNYDKALPLCDQASTIYKEVLGATHPLYATSLNNLALLYQSMGNYDKALPLFEQALTIYKEVFGDNHPLYATSLNNLALLNASIGNYDKALSLFDQTSSIYKKILGANHLDYAASLNNLAAVYCTLGDYNKALPKFELASNIYKEALGSTHPDYATSLNNLASLYDLMGNYDKALQLHELASTIRLQVLGANHPDYATSLNNLAVLYKSMGNFDKALSLYEQAKAIRLQVLGSNHPDYASSLDNLAILYESMGIYDKVFPLYEQAKTIRLQVLGSNHPDYATSLNNLAALYKSMGNYDTALLLYEQANTTYLQVLGAKHPDYATSLNNLAYLYQQMGNYDKALPLYEQAKTIRLQVLGANHPDYASLLINLAVLSASMGNYDKALPLYIQANNLLKEQLVRNFGFLSEKEKQQFMSTLYLNFEAYNSFVVKRHHVNSTATAIAYNNELLLKGSTLQSSLLMRTSILDSGDSVLIDKFNEWNRLKGQLNFLYNQPLEKRYTDVTTLEEQANTIEKDLTRCSKDFSDMQSSLSIKWEDIQQRLKPDQAVIEFISFKFHNDKEWTDSTLYVSLIVKPGYDYPAFIPLFEEKQLYDLLVYDTHIRPDFKSPNKPELLHQLYQLVWQPLEEYMEGVNYIYLSPTGLLNKIPFHALMPSENKYLIDQYDLSYLLSSRQLLKDQDDQMLTNNSTAVLFGGIYYDLDTTFLAHNARIMNEHGTLSYLPDDTLRSLFSFKYLTHTKKEVNKVNDYLETKQIRTWVYTDSLATEAQFKHLNGDNAPDVLLISTHGFYFPPPERKRDLMMEIKGKEMFQMTDNPLRRTGLAFAGANITWKGGEVPEGVDDGILTGYEVSNMDLRNTELVVLSACQTGLGDIKAGEGVFGLQRAFKLAGAKTIIMSLWNVSDKATSELMSKFFQYWIQGEPRLNAFNRAVKELQHDYPYEPDKWAAFVLVE